MMASQAAPLTEPLTGKTMTPADSTRAPRRRRSWRALCVGVAVVAAVALMLNRSMRAESDATNSRPSSPPTELVRADTTPPTPHPHPPHPPPSFRPARSRPTTAQKSRRTDVAVPLHRAVALLSSSRHLLRLCQSNARWLDTAVPTLLADASRAAKPRDNNTYVAIVVHGLMRSLRCTVRCQRKPKP
jgi:hypothetical protein